MICFPEIHGKCSDLGEMSVKKKRLGIKGKMTAVFVAMGILLSLSMGYAAYSIIYSQVTAQYTRLALSSAKAVTAFLNADNIDAYLKNGVDDEYLGTYAALQKIKTAFGLTYLYVIKPDTAINTGVYIFDIYTEGNDLSLMSKLGDEYVEEDVDVFKIVLETYLTGHIEEREIITDSEFGWLASAYVPLYDSAGSVTAVVGVDISMGRILSDIKAQTARLLIMAVAIIAAFLYILLFIADRQILRPIVRLSQHMDGFDSSDGKLDGVEVPETGDELQTMAERFNHMAGDIRLYMNNLAAVTAYRERIATELDVATKIQANMLPCIFPAFPHRTEFDIYATMQPAKEVGGDFYDYFLIDENTLAVVMADVSGKGIPAALFMVITKTLIKNNAQYGKTPKEVFETVNNLLCENNETSMFVTAFLGILDIPAGIFTYVNAGHSRPLLARADGRFEFLPTKPGFVLAGIENIFYRQDEIQLRVGDTVFLYTDGVTEASDRENNLFTESKLLKVANVYKGCGLKELLVSVKREIDIFADGTEQADDIAMLALRITGGQPGSSTAITAKELLIDARTENLDAALNFVTGELEAALCPIKLQTKIAIAVEEIFVNIAHYAYNPETGSVIIRIAVDDEAVIEFEDTGIAYNPLEKEDPDITASAAEREVGGLGIFMTKQLMDSVLYKREAGKNILTVKKHIRE